ncbi:SDR family NAD(P)-dependent oxidoreductase [Streptomyces spiralis]|uniref:SDR family NAD(P)-dependent oxidoreductase n=1 Tax=Streptomyces spiralis TaxID=66376 RepID=UPI0033D4810A
MRVDGWAGQWGAGNGLGRAIALCLADEGARVVLTGRDRSKLQAVGEEIDGTAHIEVVDVASAKSVGELAAAPADEAVGPCSSERTCVSPL